MSRTASRAASSGRHRITRSAAFSMSLRAAASLRFAGSIETSSISRRPWSRRWICRPVVPASPSMKTLGAISNSRCLSQRKRALRSEPKRPREPNCRASALRELEAASGPRAALFPALDHAAVAGQKAALLQERTQGRLEVGERLADALPERTRLPRESATGHGADDVVLARAIHHAEGLVDHHAQHRPSEVDRAVPIVDGDLARAGLDPDARDGVLALAGGVGAALGVELGLGGLRRGLRLALLRVRERGPKRPERLQIGHR